MSEVEELAREYEERSGELRAVMKEQGIEIERLKALIIEVIKMLKEVE